jgi:serine/threonine-protein kinase
MAEPSAKSFLSLLEKSQIVSDDRLKSALANLAEVSEGAKVDTQTLASHLIDSGLITRWHVDKLLGGKYKGFFLGKFKLQGHLGTGGMSSVYLAEHKLSRQTRAIKVLPRKRVSDRSYLDRFYREGQAAAALNHPNVVRIYDICSEADTHYMVMEHVKGSDLYEIVKADGPLDANVAADYVCQAAEGLQHAHEKGMVHRDIKPANLLRTDDGVIKILDLGLALFQQEGEESLTVMHNEKIMGTADYLSPEQAVNSHNVDHRADIYSLGCTLYFLLTGNPPFSQGSLAQRIAMHQTKHPQSLLKVRPKLPVQLVAICEKMMQKKPQDRFRDCEHLRQTVALFLEDPGQDAGIARPRALKRGDSKNVAGGSLDRGKKENPRSEFMIDTEAVPSSPKASLSSKILAGGSQKLPRNSQTAPQIRTRRKAKKFPVWVVPLLIMLMVVILIAVLVVAARIS